MRRALTVLSLLLLAGAARAQTSPYVDPPFASQCVVHHFDEGVRPPLDGCGDDPLRVEFEKRDSPPPPAGNFLRITPAASIGQLSYPMAAETRAGFDASDAAVKGIVERDGLGLHVLWKGAKNLYSAHPLSSCRIGDDPATSACDDRHELRGHSGLFVTDGAAVPTSLCVNPSLTIAALAERASALLLRRAGEYGLAVASRVPPPGRTDALRRRRCRQPV